MRLVGDTIGRRRDAGDRVWNGNTIMYRMIAGLVGRRSRKGIERRIGRGRVCIGTTRWDLWMVREMKLYTIDRLQEKSLVRIWNTPVLGYVDSRDA